MTTTKNKGVALISVLLIVALAAILLTEMTSRLQLQMQRTTNVNLNQQAYWYAMGAEAFAQRVLITAFTDEPEITHLGQIWAQGETSYPVDYGQITGEITDLQSCLNLNALRPDASEQSNEQAVKKLPVAIALQNLITGLDIEGVGEFEAEYMVDALSDWLDEDTSIVSAGGAEDNDYASKEFPYLPANHYLASINELRIIEHFSPAAIRKLKDYVCVIPQTNLHKININTLTDEKAELLKALLDISVDDAQSILAGRGAEGFKNVDDFFALPEIEKLKLTDEQKQQFVVDSEYFKLKASASFNNSHFAMNSIMKVDKQNINVISRVVGRE